MPCIPTCLAQDATRALCVGGGGGGADGGLGGGSSPHWSVGLCAGERGVGSCAGSLLVGSTP